jgi:hypothetical protein
MAQTVTLQDWLRQICSLRPESVLRQSQESHIHHGLVTCHLSKQAITEALPIDR